MKYLSEASNELYHSAKQIIEWYDDENDGNPHSSRKWSKAYMRLKLACREYNKIQCHNLAELIKKA